MLSSYVLEGYGLRLPDVVRVAPPTGTDSEASQRVGVLGEYSESVGVLGPSDSAILRHSVCHSDEGSVSDHVSGVHFDHASGVSCSWVRPPSSSCSLSS